MVTVSTPDHMHFPIAMEAIRLGKPVMVQKPLSNNLWETRALANYAKEKGVLTVMGNQGATIQGTFAPKRSSLVYHFPAKGKRAAVKVFWQDGVADPNTDKDFVRPPGLPADVKLNPQFGQVFIGSEGIIFFNDAYCSTAPVVFPESLMEKARTIPKVFERVKGCPTRELCLAIRGEGPKPVSNFEDQAGPLTELVLAGNFAVRLGKKIDWDTQNLSARGVPEVNSLIKRHYRTGWEPKLT